MTKTTTPFFSMGAHGTIADALTSQKRGSETLLRAKPTPAYRFTLPQAYQRWLYQDYIAYWHQQSLATQLAYASLGVPHHLTGFQYWMKYHLTNLPDIAAWWKLDDNLGPLTVDSSRNANTATLIGPSPANGIIGNALEFDGVNDYLNCGTHPSLNPTDAMTLIASVRPAWHDITGYIFAKTTTGGANAGYALLWMGPQDRLQFLGVTGGPLSDPVFTDDQTWVRVACTISNNTVTFYRNGIPAGSGADTIPYFPDKKLLLGCRPTNGAYAIFLKARLDDVRIYNRALTQPDLLRDAERSYPPQ